MCNRKISPNSLPAWWLGQHERQVHFRNRAALSFEWWVEWLLQGLNLWNAQFHAGVHRHMRKVSMAHVRKDLWDGMQINGSNMLSLQIWTQMRKCRRKFCITTLTSHVVIIATECCILIRRTWGNVPQLSFLGWNLHFITIVCRSFAFLTHSRGCFRH